MAAAPPPPPPSSSRRRQRQDLARAQREGVLTAGPNATFGEVARATGTALRAFMSLGLFVVALIVTVFVWPLGLLMLFLLALAALIGR